jgi:hypothetical protein
MRITRCMCPKCNPHLLALHPSPRRTSQNIWVMRSIYYVPCVMVMTKLTRSTRYYDAYLAFFTDYLQSHSPAEALERFVFSPAYNFRSDLAAASGHGSKEGVQPQMLSRVLGGLLHPFIHLAYGFEFDILGQIAQGTSPIFPPITFVPQHIHIGLAQAAVHQTDQPELIPPSYFTSSATDAELSDTMRRLEIAGSGTSAPAPEKQPTFAFHRRIRDDPAFVVELPSSPMLQYAAVVKSAGGAIHDHVREWTEEWLTGVGMHGGADAEARLRGMVEEVVWGNVLWYGIGGWTSRGTDGRGFNADFFMCALPTLYSAESRLTRSLSDKARTLSPRPFSYQSSSSMRASHLHLLIRRASQGSRSPVASCCSRRTSPCQRRFASCAGAPARCPSRISMQRRMRSYTLLLKQLELALALDGHKHP